LARPIVLIPHLFRLAGAISFRKDYSPPSSPPSRPYKCTNEWYVQEHKTWFAAEKKVEEEGAREAENVQMQVMKGLVAGLPRFPSECFDYLFVLIASLFFYLRC